MIKRFMVEFALDNKQIVYLRNHCEGVDDFTRNIKAMMCGALNSCDHDHKVEYVSEEIMALRDEDLDDVKEGDF